MQLTFFGVKINIIVMILNEETMICKNTQSLLNLKYKTISVMWVSTKVAYKTYARP